MDIEARIRSIVTLLPPMETITIATLAAWLADHEQFRKDGREDPSTDSANVVNDTDDRTGVEVAEVLRVSPSTVRELRLAGHFENATLDRGKGWIYPAADVEAYLAYRRERRKADAVLHNEALIRKRSRDAVDARSAISPAAVSPTQACEPGEEQCVAMAPQASDAQAVRPAQLSLRRRMASGQRDGRRQGSDRAWRKAAASAGLK